MQSRGSRVEEESRGEEREGKARGLYLIAVILFICFPEMPEI